MASLGFKLGCFHGVALKKFLILTDGENSNFLYICLTFVFLLFR